MKFTAMLPVQTELLWQNYLRSEKDRLRQEHSAELDRFVETILQLPEEVWQPWARRLAGRIVDDGEEIPVRLPLFRQVLFPALLAGLNEELPGAARWLAGFAQLLYKSPDCRQQLSPDTDTEHGLLERAVREDANDVRSKQKLRVIDRSRFDYALHELPWGVLYDNDGASIEQCGEMLKELDAYERLVMELGWEEEDREIITEARFHLPAYQRYLSERQNHPNYETFLATYKGV